MPFHGSSNGVLPLDVYEELSASGSLPASSSLKREDSVDAVHLTSSFQPKRSRHIQNQAALRSMVPSVASATSSSVHSVESGLIGASYLSFT